MLDEDTTDYTFIYLHSDHPVYGLVKNPRKLISEKYMDSFLNYARKQHSAIASDSTFILYRPSGLLKSPLKTIAERTREWLKEHHEDDSESVRITLNAEAISTILPQDRDRNCLDIIIATLETLTKWTNFGAPMAWPSGESGHFFHAARPAGNHGPPVALFDSTLGLLAFRLSHLDENLPELRPDHDECKLAHEFVHQLLDTYDSEDLRLRAIEPFVKMLGPDVGYKKTINGIYLDVVYGAATDLPYGMVELKNEFGLRVDGSIQARLSYTKIVLQDKQETKRILKASNCPAVVIGIMGEFVEIGAAVYIDGTYSDFLFSERMRLGYHKNATVLRIARAFKAVKLALADLRDFYQELWVRPPPTPAVRHLFPLPIAEPSWQGHMPSITFTHRMSHSGRLFVIASTNEERSSGIYVGNMLMANPSTSSSSAAEKSIEVVVKFTSEYNDHAHRLLVSAGFAPTLHACVPVCGNVKMVVMDRVHGEMVCGEEPRVGGMLVDFDWAGKADEARYPVIMNTSLSEWADVRVARGGIKHDLHLLRKIEALCGSAST
ncbi:hypothetical protein L226DRAFT_525636 [Lentinus tigrinus ALCF2SS1-7]|uniref:Uncharacterized protein n=1 Tax=Lentinus tigrinus ALCF2SS1-6 TaxID=1328759 RepID=A0A5C2SAU1_9APHY|nr:hypothetical protein L227DRAFT_600937 [Lentinus tigrinus ALCF2SS1-6]RPD70910.1 hypothetical protein L226DRAFT_525636 [Lentinus tigrinus ALCF2SS1-7]